MSSIAILGGGSWGTALAMVLARSRMAHRISLWVHDPVLAVAICSSRENHLYLPGCLLPRDVVVTHSMEQALQGAEIIVGAMPAAHARGVYTQARAFLQGSISADTLAASRVFVSATKGLEPKSNLRMSEVVQQVFARPLTPLVAVLSGPSFALEAARGDPTAVVVAAQGMARLVSGDLPLADYIQREFSGPSFRLYTNEDVLGVELAGAMKNVIAIAAGTCQGLGLGSNAIAALITRGLAEMARLSTALGAQPETLSGLAGLGDLVLTCTGSLSRNRRLGIELGKGRALAEILGDTRMVAEGVGTAGALLALADQHHVELPITAQVEAILHHGKQAMAAMGEIMERPLKRE